MFVCMDEGIEYRLLAFDQRREITSILRSIEQFAVTAGKTSRIVCLEASQGRVKQSELSLIGYTRIMAVMMVQAMDHARVQPYSDV